MLPETERTVVEAKVVEAKRVLKAVVEARAKYEVEDAAMPWVKSIAVEVEFAARPKLVVGVKSNAPAAVA